MPKTSLLEVKYKTDVNAQIHMITVHRLSTNAHPYITMHNNNNNIQAYCPTCKERYTQ